MTARDLDLLIPWCSRLPNNEPQDWYVNAAGLLHSVHVGFGLLDCTRLPILAQSWTAVGPLCITRTGSGPKITQDWSKRQAVVPSSSNFTHINSTDDIVNFLKDLGISEQNHKKVAELRKGFETVLNLNVTDTSGTLSGELDSELCHVRLVEKVVVHIQWKQLCRGTTIIWLQSPSGTQTTLLTARPLDYYSGPVSMTFTSVAHLGEPIDGVCAVWEIVSGDDPWMYNFDPENTKQSAQYTPIGGVPFQKFRRKCSVAKQIVAVFMYKTVHAATVPLVQKPTGKCANSIIHEYPDTLRGVVYHIDLEFWGTTEEDSSYEMNAHLLSGLITPIGWRAREMGKGKKLAIDEINSVYEFQRELAFNFTHHFIEDHLPTKSTPMSA
ncbi:unnamed protein product [Echinostoma caproni]|uniref:P/Homo B domain-containing protein n=1 Tax=Echinostoma caproni TaxID=27848 RepID=A0A183ARM2_9TREM|nr:unnamed protein product [Echinostoma caproni]